MFQTKNFAQSSTEQIEWPKVNFLVYKGQHRSMDGLVHKQSWSFLVFHQDCRNQQGQILLLQPRYEEKVYM